MASAINQGPSQLWVTVYENGHTSLTCDKERRDYQALNGKKIALLAIDSREDKEDELRAFQAMHKKIGQVYDLVIGFSSLEQIKEGLDNPLLHVLLRLGNCKPQSLDAIIYGSSCAPFLDALNQSTIDDKTIRNGYLFSRLEIGHEAGLKKISKRMIFTPNTHANFTEEDLAELAARNASSQDAKACFEDVEDLTDLKLHTVGLAVATLVFVAIVYQR